MLEMITGSDITFTQYNYFGNDSRIYCIIIYCNSFHNQKMICLFFKSPISKINPPIINQLNSFEYSEDWPMFNIIITNIHYKKRNFCRTKKIQISLDSVRRVDYHNIEKKLNTSNFTIQKF